MEKTLMEIWFDKFLLFPYKYLDYLVEEQWAPFAKSAIYFVLKGDKKRIVGYKFEAGGITITYENTKNKLCRSIGPIYVYDFTVPPGCVHVDVSSGSYLEAKITTDGIKYLEKNNPEVFRYNNLTNSIKIPLYDLIMMSERNCSTVESYSLQYIGQSTQIRERLSHHEKIQKIVRDLDLWDSNAELMILLYHPMSKFYLGMEILDCQTVVWAGGSEWQNYYSLAKEIGDKELLDATEAMLIQYFNPRYNDNFKNTVPSSTQKTFKKLELNYIHELNIGLPLQLNNSTTICLATNSASTNKRKMLILSCALSALTKNKHSEICVEEIGDWEYNIY